MRQIVGDVRLDGLVGLRLTLLHPQNVEAVLGADNLAQLAHGQRVGGGLELGGRGAPGDEADVAESEDWNPPY